MALPCFQAALACLVSAQARQRLWIGWKPKGPVSKCVDGVTDTREIRHIGPICRYPEDRQTSQCPVPFGSVRSELILQSPHFAASCFLAEGPNSFIILIPAPPHGLESGRALVRMSGVLHLLSRYSSFHGKGVDPHIPIAIVLGRIGGYWQRRRHHGHAACTTYFAGRGVRWLQL